MATARIIKQSVGKKGQNQKTDVEIVQKLLNTALDKDARFAASGVKKLKPDGKCGPLTNTAIEKYQSVVMGWSGASVDGTVEPGKTTWKSLNGNVSSSVHITPTAAPSSTIGNYQAFRQGNYQDALGHSSTLKISGHGCALTTLTMAATLIGAATEHWPEGLLPRDLTPPKVNDILRSAGAFSGGNLIMSKAANALGMRYDEYGRNTNLQDSDLDRIDNHLARGLPVAGHVDYKRGSAGDHWILIIARNNDETYTAIDPATGKSMSLTHGRNRTVNNARYSTIKDEKTGVLFGWAGSGGSANQQKYVVVRFALLSAGG